LELVLLTSSYIKEAEEKINTTWQLS